MGPQLLPIRTAEMLADVADRAGSRCGLRLRPSTCRLRAVTGASSIQASTRARRLVPFLCALLGCGGLDGPSRSPAPAPLGQTAPRGGPITLAELPALSADGRLVAVSMLLDGGRLGDGNRALALVEVETDRVARRAPLSRRDDPSATPRLEAVAEELLAAYRWIRLAQYALTEDPDAPLRQGGMCEPFRNNLAVGQGLVVRYHEPELVVRDASRGELFREAMRTWSIGANRPRPGSPQCPAYLANLKAAYGARSEGVLLAIVDFHGGSDSCPEPEDTHHVVRVAPRP
jgi:hypothetical protein